MKVRYKTWRGDRVDDVETAVAMKLAGDDAEDGVNKIANAFGHLVGILLERGVLTLKEVGAMVLCEFEDARGEGDT